MRGTLFWQCFFLKHGFPTFYEIQMTLTSSPILLAWYIIRMHFVRPSKNPQLKKKKTEQTEFLAGVFGMNDPFERFPLKTCNSSYLHIRDLCEIIKLSKLKASLQFSVQTFNDLMSDQEHTMLLYLLDHIKLLTCINSEHHLWISSVIKRILVFLRVPW